MKSARYFLLQNLELIRINPISDHHFSLFRPKNRSRDSLSYRLSRGLKRVLLFAMCEKCMKKLHFTKD